MASPSSDPIGTNWAGNHSYRAARLVRPASVDELRDVVAGSSAVRALGSRHSFTDLADTTGDLSTSGASRATSA